MSSGATNQLVDGSSDKPLQILIAGAGIGGLTAALALRQQGHDVTLFEQSRLAQETGAAIHIAPNCDGLLRRLGLKVEDIAGVECTGVIEYLPHNNQVKYEVDTTKFSDMWQHKWSLVHRAHLHTALKKLATSEEGAGRPAKLHTSSQVKHVNPETATITLQDGTVHKGDVIVGADGVHSRTRSSIPGGDKVPFDSGKSAFRFLIPTETLASDPKTAAAVSKTSYLTMWIAEDRRLIMYPCVNKTVMNFVGIHPSAESDKDISGEAGWQEAASKTRMLDIYKTFAPDIRAILEKADEPKVWKLLDMEQMPTFIHQKLAVIGDAAHPFLPHQGQGGAQAMEDAVALAAVLPLGTTAPEVEERLQIYNECRYERAHRIQNFTREAGLDAAEMAKQGKKLNMMEYQAYNFGHDAWDFATHALRKHLESKDPSLRFRSPIEFGASPGPRRPLGIAPDSAQLQKFRQQKPESDATYSIKFKTSRTYAQNLLPPGFSFASPATMVTASIRCTTLDGMSWLGGGGYSHCGLYIHGVCYAKKDGSKVFGTYLPVLFENLADPIITGRDEVGMPKLFADITLEKDSKIFLSWRGTRFAEMEFAELQREQTPPAVNGSEKAPAAAPAGPSPPPPDAGTFYYRYVPAVGQPGKVDAEYPVFAPNPEPPAGTEPPATWAAKMASLKFDSGSWQSLPTLHHVTKWLAGLPVYGIVEAKLTKKGWVSDLSGARRIE